MKIIVNTVSFKNKTLDYFIPRFKDMGILNIELHYGHIKKFKYSAHKILSYLDQYQMKAVVLSGGWCDFFEVYPYFQKTLDSIESQVEIARKINISKIRLFLGYNEPILNNIKRKILIDNLISLSEKFPDITFVFETHDNISLDFKILKSVLNQVNNPQIKINFDPANIFKSGKDPLVFLEEMYPYIDHIHIKDVKSKTGKITSDFYCSYGQGLLQYQPILNLLHKINYQKYLSIEFEGKGEPFKEIYNSHRKLYNDINNL